MASDNLEYTVGIVIPGTKYKVMRRLGAGGMGTVYEVEDTNIEKRYVLKTLHAALSSRPDLVERMRREAKTLARLEHRNIVQVITSDVTADDLQLTYIVMEKLNGHTLRTVLDNQERLPLETACRLMVDLLNALYCAHEKGIVHRDVKPENIFLHRDADGVTVTKLLDFGIMAMEGERTTSDGTRRFIGTLRYASPEQLLGHDVTAQSDLYSAGLVLYEAIAGQGPFDELGDSSKVASGHVNEPPPPLSKYVEVPRELEAIVSRALEKLPAERHQDAFTFAAELNRFRKSLQGKHVPMAPSQAETVHDALQLVSDAEGAGHVEASGALVSGSPAPSAGTPVPSTVRVDGPAQSISAVSTAREPSGEAAATAPEKAVVVEPRGKDRPKASPAMVLAAAAVLFVLSASLVAFYALVLAPRREPATPAIATAPPATAPSAPPAATTPLSAPAPSTSFAPSQPSASATPNASAAPKRRPASTAVSSSPTPSPMGTRKIPGSGL